MGWPSRAWESFRGWDSARLSTCKHSGQHAVDCAPSPSLLYPDCRLWLSARWRRTWSAASTLLGPSRSRCALLVKLPPTMTFLATGSGGWDHDRRHPRIRAALSPSPRPGRQSRPGAAETPPRGRGRGCARRRAQGVGRTPHLLHRLLVQRERDRLWRSVYSAGQALGSGRRRGFTLSFDLCGLSRTQTPFKRALSSLRPRSTRIVSGRRSGFPSPRGRRSRPTSRRRHPRPSRWVGLLCGRLPHHGAAPRRSRRAGSNAGSPSGRRRGRRRRRLHQRPRHRDAGQ